jgi:hypothetical protein
MRYLIEAAEEYGLRNIVGQALEQPQVHGIILDISPIWLRLWRSKMRGDDIQGSDLEWYYYQPSVFYTTTSIDLSWCPAGWEKRFGSRNNLVVKILLRPGSAPIKLNTDSPLNIIQEHRPVPTLAVSASSLIRPLEGGTSIGHRSDPAGTLGGILTDRFSETRYGITCGHVISAVQQSVDQPSQNDNINNSSIGRCLFSELPLPNNGTACNPYNRGVLNHMDLALIELDNSIPCSPSIINITGKISGITPSNQLHPNLVVEFNGRTSGYKSLVLGGIGLTQEIIDPGGNTCCFTNLLEVKEPSMSSLVLNRPVKGGDSGAWLVAQGATGNEWCGMIVGQDRQTGYAIMSESIMEFLYHNGHQLSI